tara:strand:- start:762 stop:1265 length:504 start_codon:yes stop_codon:yes gene_type:complete
MNNKGEMGIGVILVAFIGIIVGVTLFITVAQTVGDSTNSIVAGVGAQANVSITGPADGVTIDLTGQDLLSTPAVSNETDGTIGAGNYTIAEGVSETTGVKSIQYTAIGSEYATEPLNITYTYGPDGYIENSAGRSIALLIPIFAALAIAVLALVPTLRSDLLRLIGK